MARIDVQDLDEPVVEGTVHVEFEGADAVGYILYGVALAVGVVVHRVDAPFVAGAVMRRVLDAVHDGIAEHHVGRSHVDLSPEHLLAVGILAVAHLAEKPEVLFGGAVPVGTFLSGGLHRSAACRNLFLALVVDIRHALDYHLLGPFVELVEVIGCVKLFLPIESEPLDVFLDGVDVLGILLCGIGVVVAEIGLASVLLREPEIDAEALRVPEMKVSVGLGREAGEYGTDLPALEVVFDYFFQEIEAFLFFFHGNGRFCDRQI